jgi:hypothetical protein
MKRCSKCKIEKKETEFCKDKQKKDGLSSSCKECNKEYQKTYRKTEKFKAHQKEYQEKYRKTNKNKWKAYMREYQKEYSKTDKQKAYKRAYQKTEKSKAYHRAYRKTEQFKEYQKEYMRAYQKTEKSKAYHREYHKEKKATDPKYKLDNAMATAIRKALKGKKAGRSWESLTGYTIDDLIKHLEVQFESWMNWNNYGRVAGYWTIDHIKPKSLFNYTNPDDEEFKKCWALNNLQPLEFIENIKKSDKILS